MGDYICVPSHHKCYHIKKIKIGILVYNGTKGGQGKTILGKKTDTFIFKN